MPPILDLLTICPMRRKFANSFSKFLEQSILLMDRYWFDCYCWLALVASYSPILLLPRHHFTMWQRLCLFLCLLHFVHSAKCIVVTTICVCLSVPHLIPTLLHRPRCFTYFLLLSIFFPFSTRVVPLCFQAGGRRRWPNLGLVCLWSPYVIGRPYIFSCCFFLSSSFFFFLA